MKLAPWRVVGDLAQPPAHRRGQLGPVQGPPGRRCQARAELRGHSGASASTEWGLNDITATAPSYPGPASMATAVRAPTAGPMAPSWSFTSISSGTRPATRASTSRRVGIVPPSRRAAGSRQARPPSPARSAGSLGQPVERLVVEHHRLPVRRQLHVDLDAVARRHRRRTAASCSRAARGAVVQRPVGDGCGEESRAEGAGVIGPRRCLRSPPPRQGQPEEPTAERAWRPGVAQRLDRKSEAPLTTLGCSVKSGAELTKPVSFTTRTSRSRSPPQAARTCARRLIAQVRAAAAPAATSISCRACPVMKPSVPFEICPETWTTSPNRTHGT
jgi:hypothetical protein